MEIKKIKKNCVLCTILIAMVCTPIFSSCVMDIGVDESNIVYYLKDNSFNFPEVPGHKTYLLLKSAEQRDAYIDSVKSKNNHKPDFLDRYDDAFFSRSNLLMVGMGGKVKQLKVTKVGVKDDALYVRIQRKTYFLPDIGDDATIILIPFKKSSYTGNKVDLDVHEIMALF